MQPKKLLNSQSDKVKFQSYMTISQLIIAVFVILEISNILMLYFAPGSKFTIKADNRPVIVIFSCSSAIFHILDSLPDTFSVKQIE